MASFVDFCAQGVTLPISMYSLIWNSGALWAGPDLDRSKLSDSVRKSNDCTGESQSPKKNLTKKER
jgi:hypothetical protein